MALGLLIAVTISFIFEARQHKPNRATKVLKQRRIGPIFSSARRRKQTAKTVFKWRKSLFGYARYLAEDNMWLTGTAV